MVFVREPIGDGEDFGFSHILVLPGTERWQRSHHFAVVLGHERDQTRKTGLDLEARHPNAAAGIECLRHIRGVKDEEELPILCRDDNVRHRHQSGRVHLDEVNTVTVGVVTIKLQPRFGLNDRDRVAEDAVRTRDQKRDILAIPIGRDEDDLPAFGLGQYHLHFDLIGGIEFPQVTLIARGDAETVTEQLDTDVFVFHKKRN